MKRIAILVLSTVFCLSATGATLQRTILSHKGQLTQYDANHWKDAISDAVAGDTVYFTPGLFIGDIQITKPITLIGAGTSDTDAFYKRYYENAATAYANSVTAGQSTTIQGSINIDIPGNIALTATLLEGFHLPDYCSIGVSQAVTNLAIRRCQLTGGYAGGEFRANVPISNTTIESCFIKSFLGNNLVNADIHNCYFGVVSELPEGFELTNCVIGSLNYSYNIQEVNCIECGRYESSHNTYVNCAYSNTDSNSSYSDCWYNYDVNTQNWAKEQLESGGYLGVDGTVIGPLGGASPFTLVPSQPYVSSSSIIYDKTTGKLNVNITVKKGQ